MTVGIKEPKLIRDIQAIVNDSEIHFWTKCKKLALIKTHNRPGSYAGEGLIREFFKTCAGKHQARFDSAYVRPYLNDWGDDHRASDVACLAEIFSVPIEYFFKETGCA